MVGKAKSKDESRKHSADTHIRLEPEQRALFDEAATKAGLSLSAWIRTRLLAAAKKEAGK